METNTKEEASEGFIQIRAVLLGALLAVVFSGINGYLQINLGMSFGYGAVAVIIGYSIFHRLQGGSCRRELSFLMIASVSQMAVYNTLAFILYMMEVEGDVNFPGWLAPPKEIVIAKDLSLKYWVRPLGVLIFAMAISMLAGVIFFTILKEGLNRSPKMVWPSQSANTKLVDACMTGGGSARLVATSAVIGLVVTFLQHLPSFWGIDLTMLDLSGLLPDGALLVISFSVAFASIGYLINVNTSLSLMASGLISYLVISPYLVNRGLIEYNPDIMSYYNDYLFKYSVSPAIGIMLLGGVLLSFALVLKKILSKEGKNKEEDDLGYLGLYRIFMKGLLNNPRYLAATLGIFSVLSVASWYLNPFAPLPRYFAVAFVVYSFFIAGFMELVFITKLSGETGMGMGIISMLLYDLPLFSAGYRGYTGYWTYSFLRPNPWLGSGSLPYYKYRDETRISWRDIILAKVTGWIPTIFFSVAFTIAMWKFIGFGTPLMPAVGVIQSKVYVSMLATGDISSVLNLWTFIGGGILGALLELFTPISMMGLGMGLFLPPHYIIPFGIGGIIRLYTNRKYGRDFYNEKGRIIVTGLMASSLLVQVVMTILTNFL